MNSGDTKTGSGGRRRAEPTPLRAPGLPRLSFSTKRSRIVLGALAALLLVAWLVWYAMTPEPLATSDQPLNAAGVVDTPLYVGMYAAPEDFGRTLRISGVKVHTTSTSSMEVTPLLCRRGTIGVTTKPEQFCRELVNPEGQRLTANDSLVLRLVSAEPTLAIVDQLHVAYREDIRWDTQPAGVQQAIIQISGRPLPE